MTADNRGAIEEDFSLDDQRGWFDKYRTQFVPEIQIRMAACLDEIEKLRAERTEADRIAKSAWALAAGYNDALQSIAGGNAGGSESAQSALANVRAFARTALVGDK